MNRKIGVLLVAALGASLIGMPSYAQGQAQKNNATQQRGQKGQRGQNRGNRQRVSMEDRYAKELNLTDKQKQQINPILKKQGEQMQAIRKNDKLTQEQKRQQTQKLANELPGKINKFLNATQQQKLKQMMEKRKNFQGQRGQRGQRSQGGQQKAPQKPQPKKK